MGAQSRIWGAEISGCRQWRKGDDRSHESSERKEGVCIGRAVGGSRHLLLLLLQLLACLCGPSHSWLLHLIAGSKGASAFAFDGRRPSALEVGFQDGIVDQGRLVCADVLVESCFQFGLQKTVITVVTAVSVMCNINWSLASPPFQPNVISNANELALPLLMQPTERAGHVHKGDMFSRRADAITTRVSEAWSVCYGCGRRWRIMQCLRWSGMFTSGF